MAKRTLDSFFSSAAKKSKHDVETFHREVSPPRSKATTSLLQQPTTKSLQPTQKTAHPTYAWPIADLPPDLADALEGLLGVTKGKTISNQPHLDLLYFQPLIPQPTADVLFKFLRSSLPFYRVCYKISRFGKSLDVNTPRFTTVFGIDETSRFISSPQPDARNPDVTHATTRIVESSDPSKEVPPSKYKCAPRPIPPCLVLLKNLTEALTGDSYNFMLVNYYATGNDSISYHSDDEKFLGPNPAIASYTLGARRDFLMKHKPPPPNSNDQSPIEAEPIKFSLGSGDMLLMRGETQANWLHSIPKRKSGEADRGRINITLRKAMVPAGTENYYRYNVGDGPVYWWDTSKKEMVLWQKAS